MPAIYPFTAIVGQERMLRALILNAVDTRIGGVLIRGERGTAKSTAARALAALLPGVQVVDDCRFGCDPDKPGTWCTECKERHATSGEKLPSRKRTTPFVNLPVSATEDRVVGTLDIEQAIQKGERHFEPGVLAAANRHPWAAQCSNRLRDAVHVAHHEDGVTGARLDPGGECLTLAVGHNLRRETQRLRERRRRLQRTASLADEDIRDLRIREHVRELVCPRLAGL